MWVYRRKSVESHSVGVVNSIVQVTLAAFLAANLDTRQKGAGADSEAGSAALGDCGGTGSKRLNGL